MVDGNEEVDAILFEFNVSAVLLLFAAVCSCSVMCFLDWAKIVRGWSGAPKVVRKHGRSVGAFVW